MLILSHNKISSIKNLKDNVYLEELDLSFNQIEIIENLDYLNLRKLNLMDNKLRNITGLENLKSII